VDDVVVRWIEEQLADARDRYDGDLSPVGARRRRAAAAFRELVDAWAPA